MSMIKFAHTIFALPFAVASAALASMAARGTPWPTVAQAGLIVLACYAARTSAMTYNRIADLDIDAVNARTQNRELVTGALSVRWAWGALALHCALFVAAAFGLNGLAFGLSPVCLAILLGYSHAKRFTWLAHVWLGLALGIAPIGAWIAIDGAGVFSRGEPWLLGLSVLFWVSGFDVIYSCQDREFDTAQGLRSIPARFGVGGGLRIARGLHLAAAGCFVAFWSVAGLGWIALAGVVAIAGLLIYEHSLVSENDLSRVNAAFFTMNGAISLVFCAAILIDLSHAG